MRVNVTLKNLTKTEKNQVDNYLPKKVEKIEKLLNEGPDDISVLKVNIEKFNKNQAYKARIVLGIGNRTLYSDEDSFSIAKAIDLSEEKLTSQIRKNFKGKKK